METSVWPRVRAQRAFCEAEILARAAALILRGPCNRGALFNPVSALIAESNEFTCCAALSRSAFNCAIMSMFASGEDCSKYSRNYTALCINVNSAQKHRQAPSFLRSAAIDLPAIASYHSLQWPRPHNSSGRPFRITASSSGWVAAAWVWCTKPKNLRLGQHFDVKFLLHSRRV